MAHFKVKGILSYPHLFKPRQYESGDAKYQTSVLIKKTDPQLAEIQKILEQEKANGFPSGFPAKGKVFLKDAAEEYPDNASIKDYMIVQGTAKEDAKPLVVDQNLDPVMDPAQAYPGSVAWVQFNSYSYDMATSKGVTCGLNGVMLTGEEGELGRLDSRPDVHQMFGDVANGAEPSPPKAPAPPSPPAPPKKETASLVMTEAANGMSYQQYIDAGWSEEQMIDAGVAQKPSFA